MIRGEGIGALNRLKTHCPTGHPYEGENLYRPARGGRMCRTCIKAGNRQRYLEGLDKDGIVADYISRGWFRYKDAAEEEAVRLSFALTRQRAAHGA
jgi:hypothetical protein